MNRIIRALAVAGLGALPFLAADPAPASHSDADAGGAAAPGSPAPAPVPPRSAETLRDLRAAVAAGKLGGAAALCDRLQQGYEKDREAELGPHDGISQAEFARHVAEGYLDSFMACYCIYAKAQVLALTQDALGADAALQAARVYRTARPEMKLAKLVPIFQEIDAVTAGFLLEKQDKLDEAVQAYLPANSSAKATSRLAVIAQARGQTDQARTWALINADDPTSQWVLAQLALKSNNGVVAQRHAATGVSLLQKSLAAGKEFMPVYYCEAPAILALRKSLQKFAPRPPALKITAPPPAPATPADG